MDFSYRAWLVMVGYKTDIPSPLTYSSVVLYDSIFHSFLLAALKGLDILPADIGNAYINDERKFT